MKNIYLLICLFLATSFYAQTSLFSPNDRQEILSENLYENEIKASHLVLNTDAFLSESISFNPFDNEPIIIDKNNSVSGNSWVGKIRNQQFGYFIISESKGIYFGKAVLDSGKIMMIRHQKNNTYRVSEISPDSVNIDEDCEAVAQLTDRDDTPDDEQVDQDYGPDVCDTSVTCSDVVMDVLVVYSDALLTAQGSAATIEAAVQSAITEANLTLSNSQQDGTNHTFNVVAIEEINFLEDSSGSANLSALRADETVIDLRNRHSADLVALILNGGSCGIGNVNSDNLGFQSTAGHSVTRWSCMTGNLTLTHEMGHNIGFRHNRYSDTSNAGICDYGYGYVNENAASSTDQRWRTAMAYNAECSAQGFNCTRLTYFSNPDVTIGTAADPAGKAIGDAEAANNAEVLERSACHVAQFRTAATCTDCILYQNCENYATDFDSGPGNSLQIDISDTFASVVSAGTVEICLNLFGDNSGTSEQFS
ncbi:MAG: zinc-dependent metalloprotease family protein, partial [Polaribacter sp.]